MIYASLFRACLVQKLEADFGLSCPFLLSKWLMKKYSAARLWRRDSGHRIYTIDHLSVRWPDEMPASPSKACSFNHLKETHSTDPFFSLQNRTSLRSQMKWDGCITKKTKTTENNRATSWNQRILKAYLAWLLVVLTPVLAITEVIFLSHGKMNQEPVEATFLWILRLLLPWHCSNVSEP